MSQDEATGMMVGEVGVRHRHRPHRRSRPAVELGVHTFLDLETEKLEDAGEVDVVFDVIGGDILARSTALVRAGVTLVTIAEPPQTQPRDGRALYFIVEADRARLADLAVPVHHGRLTPVVGAVLQLAEPAAAFAPDKRIPGKTILRLAQD
jgi:NADPH:quinone reductase-like Zn-dependent oxidoreductase